MKEKNAFLCDRGIFRLSYAVIEYNTRQNIREDYKGYSIPGGV